MDEEEKKNIIAEIDAKKKELVTLKTKLAELNTVKESWFEKKRKFSKDISDISRSIRDAKGKRNTFTKQVKDSKLRRRELNTLLKKKLVEMKKCQQEKRETTKRFGIHVDPSKIQEEIEQLEFRIETEALPFNIEQQMMKLIAERKKFLEQAREVSDVFEKVHKLEKELDKIRKKADETHKKVQTKAETSQKFHEELVESSTEMKDLRAKEDDALKKFVEAKTKYNEQNELVKAKLGEIAASRAKVEGIDFEKRKKEKKAKEKIIVEQKRGVEEKIKKGLKLTTEDLLAFQAKEITNRPGKGRKQRKPKPRKEE